MDQSVTYALAKLGKFSEKEVALFQQELNFRTFKKDDFLLHTGEVCAATFLVVSGSFYHSNTDADLNQNIIDLNVAQDWVINHKSFVAQKPSAYAIQAFEDSSGYEIGIDAMHRLIALSQAYLQMGKILEEATSRTDFFDNNHSPDEKYQYLLDNKPQILQSFPQKMIAKYLKITPETLSRVRSRLSKP